MNPPSTPTLRRVIHPEVRIVDASRGIVDYVASDETLDSYREIIRASGWRFTNFRKNAPFVDSHDYASIDKLVGKVIEFGIQKVGPGLALVERVQWAIDVPDNKLAQLGWKMTEAGYLKAVSVGFWPVRFLTPGSDRAAWLQALTELGIQEDAPIRTIYTEQEQVELSTVIIGANPNALARAYKSGAIGDAELETISQEINQRETARAAIDPADAARARQRARESFLEQLQNLIS